MLYLLVCYWCAGLGFCIDLKLHAFLKTVLNFFLLWSKNKKKFKPNEKKIMKKKEHQLCIYKYIYPLIQGNLSILFLSGNMKRCLYSVVIES